MATILDIGLLQDFGYFVFPFLLVLIAGMAILRMAGPFKDKPAFAFLIALVGALMTMSSSIAIKAINMMAPWYVLFLFLMLLIIVAYQTFGIESGTITEYITKSENGGTIGRWILGITIAIFVLSLGYVIQQEEGVLYAAGGPDNETVPSIYDVPLTGVEGFWATVFNPKVMGLVLIMLIAFFTVQYLSESAH